MGRTTAGKYLGASMADHAVTFRDVLMAGRKLSAQIGALIHGPALTSELFEVERTRLEEEFKQVCREYLNEKI